MEQGQQSVQPEETGTAQTPPRRLDGTRLHRADTDEAPSACPSQDLVEMPKLNHVLKDSDKTQVRRKAGTTGGCEEGQETKVRVQR